jgi:hypothetical protein
MLKSFVGVRYIPVLRYIVFEEILCFLNFPDPQSRVVVDLLLKKNRHCFGFYNYFAAESIEGK